MNRSMLCVAFAVSTLAVSPVTAQTVETQAPAQPPTLSTPAITVPAIGGPGFLIEAEAGQYRASQLIGLNVYNSGNESIGDVNELLVDKDGAIQAVVIGVSGFLGIGEKNVALPYAAIRWDDKPLPSPSASMGSSKDTTGSVPLPADTSVRDSPDHGILNMTKAQLEAAPAFKFAARHAP